MFPRQDLSPSLGQLKQMRDAAKNDSTLVKFKRYWDKSGKSVRAETIFSSLEHKLQLTFSVIISKDQKGNLLLYALNDKNLHKDSSTRIKFVQYLGLLNPDPTNLDPHIGMVQIVKIQKRTKKWGSDSNYKWCAKMEMHVLTHFQRKASYLFHTKTIVPQCNKDYFFQDYISGSDLQDCIEKKFLYGLTNSTLEILIHSQEMLRLSISLLRALQSLHQARILHRDIKLDNIMHDYATGKVALIDFGFAIHSKMCHQVRLSLGGTKAYYAPEFLTKEAQENGIIYSPGSDIYAMGLVLRYLWWFAAPTLTSEILRKQADSIIYTLLMKDKRFFSDCLPVTILHLEKLLDQFITFPFHYHPFLLTSSEKEEKTEAKIQGESLALCQQKKYFYSASNSNIEIFLCSKEILKLTIALLRKLEMIHQLSFAHGNIKLENILYDRATGKVALINNLTLKPSEDGDMLQFDTHADRVAMRIVLRDLWSDPVSSVPEKLRLKVNVILDSIVHSRKDNLPCLVNAVSNLNDLLQNLIDCPHHYLSSQIEEKPVLKPEKLKKTSLCNRFGFYTTKVASICQTIGEVVNEIGLR